MTSQVFIAVLYTVIMLPPACLVFSIFLSLFVQYDDDDNDDAKKAKGGPIACQVGLGGMKPSERKSVLEHLYRSRTREYCACDSSCGSKITGDYGCATNRQNNVGFTDNKTADVEMGSIANKHSKSNSRSDGEEVETPRRRAASRR